MNILLTGANGFIGGHLLSALVQRPWQIDGVVRGATPAGLHRVWPDCHLQAADLQGIDVIFHLAGLAHAHVQNSSRTPAQQQALLHQVNVQETQALYNQAALAGVPRFIWLSSIKVLGEGLHRDYRVDDPRLPEGVYAASKAAAETSLLANQQAQTQLAIVRPPLVYGAGVKANFLKLMKLAQRPWPLPLAGARQPRAWLGVDNLVDLLLHLAQADCQGIWHVCDREQVSSSLMLEQLALASGGKARQWYVSERLARRVAGWLGQEDLAQRLFSRLTVDMQLTSERLGWQPPHTQQQQISRAVAWLQAR